MIYIYPFRLLFLGVFSLVAYPAAAVEIAPTQTDLKIKIADNEPAIATLEAVKVVANATSKESGLAAYGANRVTVITQTEMKKYGDTSVQDALRRSAGPQGGKGGFRGMRGGPTFQINGETVAGGHGGANAIIESLDIDDIDRIEVIRQPSATQPGSGSGLIINIITKKPTLRLFGGAVKVGAGHYSDSPQSADNLAAFIRMDGRQKKWGYSLSANEMRNDSQISNGFQKAGESINWQRSEVKSRFQLFNPKLDYTINENNKLFADYFFGRHDSKTNFSNTQQEDEMQQNRLNLRWENYGEKVKNTLRLNYQNQHEDTTTNLLANNQSWLGQVRQEMYGGQYSGEYRTLNHFTRYGVGVNRLTQQADEQRYVSNSDLTQNDAFAYVEDNWNITKKNRITAGLRQEYLSRRVDLSSVDGAQNFKRTDSPLNPTLYYKYVFSPDWNWQIGGNRTIRPPRTDDLFAIRRLAIGPGAGSISNPDDQGNPDLQSERITSFDTTLTYNKGAKNFNATVYDRRIKNYIEPALVLLNDRYVETAINQSKAKARGLELEGKYDFLNGAIHQFATNGQLTTSFVQVEDQSGDLRRANGVAAYNVGIGLSYQYVPWKLGSSINFNYMPTYSRLLSTLPYLEKTYAKPSLDLNITSNYYKNWVMMFSARNLLHPDHQVEIYQEDGSLKQTSWVKTLPMLMFSLERKF